jgi:hypothetical protein
MNKSGIRLTDVLILCLICFLLGGGCFYGFSKMRDNARSLETRWRGDTFYVSNITGRILITNLMIGTSGPAATLHKPIFIIDSEGAKFPYEQMKKLEWRGVRGEVVPPPAVGTPITVLFVRLEGSELPKATKAQ